jgi:hypothetical protein
MTPPSWFQSVRERMARSTQTLTRRVTLGIGLLSIAAGQTPGEPRLPVNPTPTLVPDVEVRKLNGRYLLRRGKTGLQVFFAGHRSHSSHASHASHSSHYSGASTPSPTPTPTPSPSPTPTRTPSPTPTPAPVAVAQPRVPRTTFTETFADTAASSRTWRRGVFLDPRVFDPQIQVVQRDGLLEITPRAHYAGRHFSGYVSRGTVDLSDGTFTIEVREVPNAGAQAVVLLAADAMHYVAIHADAVSVTIDCRDGDSTSHKTVHVHTNAHRFWRFRQGDSSSLYDWASSPDGLEWTVLHTFPLTFSLDRIIIELGAGTLHAVASPGKAAFRSVQVSK